MFTRKPTHTLSVALRRAVLRAVSTFVLAGIGFIAMAHMPVQGTMVAPEHNEAPSVEAPAKGSPTAVLARMGDKCWTGEAPADVTVPGHVVYSDGADGAKVGGSRMVGIALDSIFKKPVKGLTVYAFCR